MEKTINVIIVNINRHDFLSGCLKSINDAAKNTSFKIEISLITDTQFSESAKNIINHLARDCKLNIFAEKLPSGIFNKSYLLNQAIEKSSNFDLIAVIDVDMLVSPIYFNAVISHLVRSNLVVANGYKLNCDRGSISYSDIANNSNKSWFIRRNRGDYPSQIIFDQKMLELFRKVLDRDRIYDERLTGWGGEDCLILRIAWKLHRKNIAKIAIIDNLWYHKYHADHKRDSHRPFYNKICREIDNKFSQFLTKGNIS